MQRAKIKFLSLMTGCCTCVCCSCRMRRKRLIRPTVHANPFNFNARCRPDKRSASGNFNV
ncbi:hypothetical protein B2J87_06680 [Escherichia coli]|nr:hypothetical protein B2J87_06680 [Escherichia coli]OOC70092.1 hypothetical protein BWP13_09570 [Escherichia coli ATCC 8739]OKV24883.1 hypothetical protein AWP49_25285 [Escherichia coli]OKW54739.1 hypothetical protein AWP79_00120 [Escherichia coli]OKW63735.1 hypothetical protein AWP73_14795 [Escherichia coli]